MNVVSVFYLCTKPIATFWNLLFPQDVELKVRTVELKVSCVLEGVKPPETKIVNSNLNFFSADDE